METFGKCWKCGFWTATGGGAAQVRPALPAARGGRRARSHCRFVSPRIHFIIDSRRESVPLFLKRPGDRAPGGRRPARALRAGLRARLGDRRREVRGSARTHLLSLSRRVANRDQPCAGVGSKPTGPVKSFEKFCAQEAAEMASTQPHEQNLGRAPPPPPDSKHFGSSA